MRKLKEVLRLQSLGLSQHQIARSCSISQSTVHEYVAAAQAAGLKWPLPEDWDDGRIEKALFPQRSAPVVWRKHAAPDWLQIQQELQTHKNLTLQLLWQERREGDPAGYSYSRFCDLYRRWQKKLDLVLRQEHRAGEKMFVDYAGATIPIHHAASGEVQAAAVFVAVLGASSYTFAEATSGQDLRSWIGSHIRALEFFGGAAEVIVPDNLKSAVTHASYYEPDLNPTYRDLGEHYGVAIIPARPYRARDKAKAEVGVQIVQRWIVAALRKHKFFSLAEANQAIAGLLVALNQRPFRKRVGNRATLFAQLDHLSNAEIDLPAGLITALRLLASKAFVSNIIPPMGQDENASSEGRLPPLQESVDRLAAALPDTKWQIGTGDVHDVFAFVRLAALGNRGAQIELGSYALNAAQVGHVFEPALSIAQFLAWIAITHGDREARSVAAFICGAGVPRELQTALCRGGRVRSRFACRFGFPWISSPSGCYQDASPAISRNRRRLTGRYAMVSRGTP